MNALHLIRARDAAFVRRERTIGRLLLSAMPAPLLVLLYPFWAVTMHEPLASEFSACLLACALWPVLAAEVAVKAAPRMRIVGTALALVACGNAPSATSECVASAGVITGRTGFYRCGEGAVATPVPCDPRGAFQDSALCVVCSCPAAPASGAP